ncbi:PREDICTED: uncharacterized protein LOC107348139 isoform X1 [Acropora digitifera]|uniref:uncharacterized protein LOC107348139 isoform X1 n=2 Tax=Acropora digitifera TaxID=70779 RepID=UPI00077A0574|nr:PREDICTED: uncharacterized protein LOC107348139 isoform X1 [Acropora digitifera]
MDGIVERCGPIFAIFVLFVHSVELSAQSNCTESHLSACQDQFNDHENTLPICPEVLKLRRCLAMCSSLKKWPSLGVKIKYELAVKKLRSYSDCIPNNKDGKKCNEELISKCYQQYNGTATPICPEVKKLRICISELVGCHAMKHPKFVHLSDVLEKHRRCFFVNYSRILEVLKSKDRRFNRNCTESLLNNCQEQFNKSPIQICGKSPRLRACLEPCRVVKSWPSWVARVTYESLVKKIQDCDEERVFCGVSSQGASPSSSAVSTKELTSESKLEQNTGSLPYTFVVVATVCTCLFLVVLVVFSIVRHTTLSKRQRHTAIERAPMRIRIRPQTSRDRTRRHRHHRSHRGRSTGQGGAARQTVSGFFEGNVAPPPYSAVLDDNESVRAGDAPPPYRPPSCVGIGVIV